MKFCLFETISHWVDLVILELTIRPSWHLIKLSWPLPPGCWDLGHVPPCLAEFGVSDQIHQILTGIVRPLESVVCFHPRERLVGNKAQQSAEAAHKPWLVHSSWKLAMRLNALGLLHKMQPRKPAQRSCSQRSAEGARL